MPRDRVVIVGAGVAGLVSAFALAARGLDVTVLERSTSVGGKMRQVAIGPALIDSGPTVFTMRWVFEELFAAAGKNFADHVRLRPLEVLARHAWDEHARLDLFADEERTIDAIGDFAGAAEADGYRTFCRDTKRIYDILEKPFLRASQPSMGGLIGADGLRGLMRLPQIKPFSSMWSALGRYFADPRLQQLFGRYATYCGSSPYLAPATLMLVAHVEREGVWSIDGGMQALATALADGARSFGATIRCGQEVSEVLLSCGRAAGVRLASGERIPADAVIVNADVGAVANGLFGIPARRGAAAIPDRARSLSAMTWSAVAKTDGFPLHRHNVFFSGDYAAEFDDIFTRDTLARRTDSLCLRAGSRRQRHRQIRAGTASRPRQRACQWRPAFLRCSGGGTMRAADIWRAGAARAADPATDGCDAGDDACGFQPDVSGDGRRALRPQLTRMDGLFPAAGSPDEDPGTLSGGGQHASRSGGADGGAGGPVGGGQPARGPDFSKIVPPNGYAWWYVDALSDDGQNGITIIAFIGSVFSPYYAFARRNGPADPLNHCAINVAVYTKGSNRWAMTERPRGAVSRTSNLFTVGPSNLSWDGKSLVIRIDEITVPIPRRLRGTIRVVPTAITQQAFTLNESGNHRWWPIAPCARVQVALDQPHLRWQGDGYFDMNRGDAPLESGFVRLAMVARRDA